MENMEDILWTICWISKC